MDVDDEVEPSSTVSKAKGKGKEVASTSASASGDDDEDAEDVEELVVEKKKFDYATAPNGLDPVKGAAAALSKSIKVKKTRKAKTREYSFLLCLSPLSLFLTSEKTRSSQPGSKLTFLSSLLPPSFLRFVPPFTAYVEFGDFKKPPMSMAETKKGNKSMIFHS